MQIDSLRITRKYPLIFALIICAVFLSSCISLDPITLHGDIKGSVTDAQTSESIQGATVELIQYNVTTDTTITGNDGTYLLKNIIPEDYEIQASKFAYGTSTDTLRVTINKTGLSDSIIYKEKIEITSTGGPAPLQDTIGVMTLEVVWK